jgi:hypothetical protein
MMVMVMVILSIVCRWSRYRIVVVVNNSEQ